MYVSLAGLFSDLSLDIDRDNLLPPLLVIQILSSGADGSTSNNTSLSLIKDYITRRLQQENQFIAEDNRQIRNFKEETKKMRNEIQELKTRYNY